MNILHVSSVKHWGGGENQIKLLYSQIQKIDSKVNQYILCRKNSEVSDFLLKEGFNVIEGTLFPKVDLRFVYKIIKLCKSRKIDVVHIHDPHALTLCAIATRLSKKLPPFIFGKKTSFPINQRKSTQFKYNHDLIKKIICVSKATKEVTINGVERPERVEVVYDSIELSFLNKKTPYILKEKLGISSKKRVIINIANHYDAKDITMLPKIANEIVNNQKVKNVHFLQIGRSTKFTSEFLELIEKYELKNNFTYLNFLENASHYLSEFDIYLMTSKSEGIPLTLHEAFAKEIPVVTTTAGGISELIKHRENGFSAEIGDYMALANLCVEILDNKNVSKALTSNALQTLKSDFDPKVMASKTLDIYKEVIGK